MPNTLPHSHAVRPVTGLAALARRYAEDPSNWPFAPRFDPVSRWYARIGGDQSHEAWLLTWLPGQSTDLHDHGGSAGAFVVVSGVLTEQVATAAGPAPAATVAGAGPVTPVETTLAAGAVRAFGPRHVHRIVNAGTAPAVSLHVYAPSLRQMTRYRIDGGVLSVEVVEKAGVDW
jgi:mannose-6-phosphate isomerase-like protein (cupin superfamily)